MRTPERRASRHRFATAAARAVCALACWWAVLPGAPAARAASLNSPLVWTREAAGDAAAAPKWPASLDDTGAPRMPGRIPPALDSLPPFGTTPMLERRGLLDKGDTDAGTPALDGAPDRAIRPEQGALGNAAAAAAKPYHALITAVAGEVGLDARLVDAVVSVESNYNASSVSRKGAVGLMQVMPSTGRSLGFTNLRDADTNLRAGATYLKSLLERYGYDVKLALAAYNAGAGAVDRHGPAVPPYDETQNYVRKVLARYHAAAGIDAAPSADGMLRRVSFNATNRDPDAQPYAPAATRPVPAARSPGGGEAWSAIRKLGSLLISAPAD